MIEGPSLSCTQYMYFYFILYSYLCILEYIKIFYTIHVFVYFLMHKLLDYYLGFVKQEIYVNHLQHPALANERRPYT